MKNVPQKKFHRASAWARKKLPVGRQILKYFLKKKWGNSSWGPVPVPGFSSNLVQFITSNNINRTRPVSLFMFHPVQSVLGRSPRETVQKLTEQSKV